MKISFISLSLCLVFALFAGCDSETESSNAVDGNPETGESDQWSELTAFINETKVSEQAHYDASQALECQEEEPPTPYDFEPYMDCAQAALMDNAEMMAYLSKASCLKDNEMALTACHENAASCDELYGCSDEHDDECGASAPQALYEAWVSCGWVDPEQPD